MKKLENKVAVITGGNSGIGFEAAKEFLAQGAKVVITGRNQAALDAAVKELGGPVSAVVADTAKISDTDKLVERVTAQYGKVDVLFINAGVSAFLPVEKVTEEHFDMLMNVNFKGAFFTLSKFVPHLREGSSVIFLSAINAQQIGMPNFSIYSASKAAINAVVNVASYELASKKIRINAVSPGPIYTAAYAKTGMDQASLQQLSTAIQNRIPVKRLGKAEEVAKLVTYLASDDASFITGANYIIDGGMQVNPVLS